MHVPSLHLHKSQSQLNPSFQLFLSVSSMRLFTFNHQCESYAACEVNVIMAQRFEITGTRREIGPQFGEQVKMVEHCDVFLKCDSDIKIVPVCPGPHE